MIQRILPFLLLLSLGACRSHDSRPDISGIRVDDIHIVRFDTAFFNIDSNHIRTGLFQLNQRYPYFAQDFVANILGAEPMSDTSTIAFEAAREFYVSYLRIRDSLEPKYRQLGWLEKELELGFRYVKY